MMHKRPIAWRWRKLGIASIKVDGRFQPRVDGVSDALVKKYAWEMRRGDEFPPIKVARVGKELCVLDGFHRLAAAIQAGVTEVPAQVASMSEQEAVWVAIEANATHGKNLTGKDKRNCFRRYCDTGRHLQADGSIKSLRQMQRELHHIASPTTLSKWLKAAGIKPSAGDSPAKEWQREDSDETPDLGDFDVQLRALEQLFHGLKEEDQPAAIARISALAHRFEAPVRNVSLDI